MLKFISVLVVSILASSSLLYMPNALADYEIPDAVLGYKMTLSSQARTDKNQTYIGFVQYKNMTPPFVIIETKAYDLIVSEVLSEIVDGKLMGKIILPPSVSAEDITELRINGYSILWKNAK